jgi:hypothetical protein
MRKTIGVLEMLNSANRKLAREDEFATQKFKAGICSMIEEILHCSGNYHGFIFLHPNQEVGSPNYYSRHYLSNQNLSK